ncbi:MAG: putative transglutaminase-like cysteine proteinase [Alphaproteobacteria bacterium]|jgi:predicted transglutaminase-like cysteine proteinase
MPVPARRQLLRLFGAAAVGAGLTMSGPLIASAMAAPSLRLFGKSEKRGKNVNLFRKWIGALTKHFEQVTLMPASCDHRLVNHCNLQQWQAFLDTIRDRPTITQIDLVNREMNSRKYVTDIINWNIVDYWAPPGDFLRKNGDCEDYAIAKYLSLRELGFDPNLMRICVVYDTNLRVHHAVLAVEWLNDYLILDNQIRKTVSHRRIRHYKPVYAINEAYWWAFPA